MRNKKLPTARDTHRRRTYTAGKRAELAALIYLMCKGYRLLAQRFKCPSGEIDLIFKRGNLVIFIEVKFRTKKDDAAFSITPRRAEVFNQLIKRIAFIFLNLR